MIKRFLTCTLLLMLSACTYFSELKDKFSSPQAPVLTSADYADYAKNVSIAGQGENYIIYEYKNIRVDDLAVLAALYCHEQNNSRAYLENITLYHNNARRAKFMCR